MTVGASKNDLAARLWDEIADSPPGARVPPIRHFAEKLSVSQFAVQMAFKALKDEGRIQSFVGRGSFIASADGAQDDIDKPDARSLRVLIVCHATRSKRGYNISESLRSRLARRGHRPILVSYTDIDDLSDLLGVGGFDACVLQPRRSRLPVEVLAMLKEKAEHLIVEGRQLEFMDIDVVVRNRAKSTALAFEHLHGLGHRRIGLLTERVDEAAGYAEVENLYNQMCRADGTETEPTVLQVPITEQGEISDASVEEAADIVCADDSPTAYIVSGRFQPSELMRFFKGMGKSIPQDLSIVQLRRMGEESDEDIGMTSVGRTTAQVARTLVDVIKWRIAHPNEPAGLVLDDPVLNVGQSTRQVSREKAFS